MAQRDPLPKESIRINGENGGSVKGFRRKPPRLLVMKLVAITAVILIVAGPLWQICGQRGQFSYSATSLERHVNGIRPGYWGGQPEL
jgi:hypothetical protein